MEVCGGTLTDPGGAALLPPGISSTLSALGCIDCGGNALALHFLWPADTTPNSQFGRQGFWKDAELAKMRGYHLEKCPLIVVVLPTASFRLPFFHTTAAGEVDSPSLLLAGWLIIFSFFSDKYYTQEGIVRRTLAEMNIFSSN